MYDHQIDPGGDTVVSLRLSVTPFAKWKPRPGGEEGEEFESATTRREYRKGKKGKLDPLAIEWPEPDPDPDRIIQFQVSSRHLALASPMLKAMLCTAGAWSEAQKDEDGLYQISAKDWDETAFSIVLHVLHCQYSKVPEDVDLETLTKIAVIVDYYQLHEAMVLVSRTWLGTFKKAKLPTELNRELCLWLTVASVFREAGIFKSLTRIAILNAWKDMDFPEDLPIPPGVISRIRDARDSSITAIVSGLQELRGDYLNSRKGCQLECTAMHLGVLTISMHKLNINDNIAMGGDKTIQELVKGLEEMPAPQWSQQGSGYYICHSCPYKGDEAGQVGPNVFNLMDTQSQGGGGYWGSNWGILNMSAAGLVQNVKHLLVGLELSEFVTISQRSSGTLF